MWLFDKLFRKAERRAVKKPAEVPAEVSEAVCEPKPPYLTETVVFGMHLYRTADEDSSVYFVDESRGIRKLLVDSVGRIRNFPGIETEDFWTKAVSPNALKPQIRFRTSFEKRQEKWIMLWQIQPDGRYWEDDDGFGAEKDEEVTLYTYVDMDGTFTAPFRIYRIGEWTVCQDRFEDTHAEHYEEARQMLSEGKLNSDWVPAMFPPHYKMDVRHVSRYYSLYNEEDALAYWKHPLLSVHLREMTELLLRQEGSITDIVEYPYSQVLRSCMTLFLDVTGEAVFQQVLDKFFSGLPEKTTRFWIMGLREARAREK